MKRPRHGCGQTVRPSTLCLFPPSSWMANLAIFMAFWMGFAPMSAAVMVMQLSLLLVHVLLQWRQIVNKAKTRTLPPAVRDWHKSCCRPEWKISSDSDVERFNINLYSHTDDKSTSLLNLMMSQLYKEGIENGEMMSKQLLISEPVCPN